MDRVTQDINKEGVKSLAPVSNSFTQILPLGLSFSNIGTYSYFFTKKYKHIIKSFLILFTLILSNAAYAQTYPPKDFFKELETVKVKAVVLNKLYEGALISVQKNGCTKKLILDTAVIGKYRETYDPLFKKVLRGLEYYQKNQEELSIENRQNIYSLSKVKEAVYLEENHVALGEYFAMCSPILGIE